jgi:hypothetical protein
MLYVDEVAVCELMSIVTSAVVIVLAPELWIVLSSATVAVATLRTVDLEIWGVAELIPPVRVLPRVLFTNIALVRSIVAPYRGKAVE